MFRMRPKRPILRGQLAAANPVQPVNFRSGPVWRASVVAPTTLTQQPVQTSGFKPYALAAALQPTAVGPSDWLPATYFPGTPYPTARRWVKIDSPHPQAPGLFHSPGEPQKYAFYNAILFTQWGAQQQQLVAELRHTESGALQARILPQFSWDTSDPGPGSWPGGPDIPPG